MTDTLAFATALLLAYLLVVPGLVLAHELAHAAAGLALLSGPVRVSLGLDPRWVATVGRLEFAIDPAGWRSWWPGFYGTATAPNGYRGAAVALTGPSSSLVAAVLLLAASTTTAGVLEDVCQAGANWAVLQCLMTAVPMTYPDWMPGYAGLDSDGKRALRYLRG